MISLDTSSIAKFESDFAIAWIVFEEELSRRFTSFTQHVFASLVRSSPQWSSNLAGNWNYSVGTPDTSYNQAYDKGKPLRLSEKPFQRGDDPAVARTIARMTGVPAPSWRDTVYMTNATPADEGGYLAELLENGKPNLRPVNLIQGQVALFDYTVRIYQDEQL